MCLQNIGMTTNDDDNKGVLDQDSSSSTESFDLRNLADTQVITGRVDRPPPVTRRSINRLHTVEGCRREIARVTRECIGGERDTLDGHRIVGMLHICARLIQGVDLEKYVEEIEDRLKKMELQMRGVTGQM